MDKWIERHIVQGGGSLACSAVNLGRGGGPGAGTTSKTFSEASMAVVTPLRLFAQHRGTLRVGVTGP